MVGHCGMIVMGWMGHWLVAVGCGVECLGCGVYMRMGVCVGGGCHLLVIELGKSNFCEGVWGWGVDVGVW